MKYEEYNWPMKDKTKTPFDHQKETVKFLVSYKGNFNLSDIGTGKTLSALWATDLLFHNDRIKKVLIASTLTSLQLVWGAEIFHNFPHRYYAIAHGNRDYRVKAIQSDAHYVIINHDGIGSVLQELINEHFDIWIIDESTVYKNAQSDRTKTALKLARSLHIRDRAIWSITGNPRPNSPTEVFSQAKITNPRNPNLPMYYGQFRDLVVQEVGQGVWVPKPNANAYVNAALSPSIRFSREDCLDIPPDFTIDVPGGMTKEQQEAYDDMKNQLYVQHDNGEIIAVNAGVKMQKLLQITAGVVLDSEGREVYFDAKEKMNIILETFEELGQTKLIVAAAFVGVVNRLAKQLQGMKIKTDVIYGNVPFKQRTEILNRFQTGDLQILVVQPQAVAHSVTLTASNTIIWHSYVASGEFYLQMNGRITRAGQTKKQYIKHLINSKVEDRMVNRILKPKVKEAKELLKMAELSQKYDQPLINESATFLDMIRNREL